VTLTPSQRNAIKINAAAPYLFRNEIDATGSVNFAEDPTIVQAESTLLSAAATYATAEKELARAQALYPTKGVSQRELEQATSDQQSAKAALAAAKTALGVLGKTESQINRVVAAGQIPSPALQRSEFKWVLANVNEGDAPSVQVGQAVRIEADAVPGRDYFGKVAEIYSVVDPNLHRESVRIEVRDAEGELRPGMLADVHIAIKRPNEAISILDNGVVREGDGTMTAWVTADRRRFVQRHVEVGSRQDGRAQILKGIRTGELVVTDGAVLLDNLLQAPAGDQ
jgi:cobalt-zinc-cadmium efflux system membrane fusion protein